jgi:hypothetical protein
LFLDDPILNLVLLFSYDLPWDNLKGLAIRCF